MKVFIEGLACLALACGVVLARPAPELVDFFSFEQDMQDWVPNGSGLVDGSGTTIPWSITRSQAMVKDGEWSVRLFLINNSDEGTIWIQRPFTLQPHQTYQVQVRYFMAPIDGPVASAIIVAGAFGHSPGPDELGPFLEERTSLGRRVGANKWARHDYEFTAQADDAGSLYVFIGIGADFEVGYQYYVDSIRTTFTMRQPGVAEPIIDSVDFDGSKRLRIRGSGFGPSPRVIINNADRSDSITVVSNGSIKLKGTALDFFGSQPRRQEAIQVVDDTTAAASQAFHLTLAN